MDISVTRVFGELKKRYFDLHSIANVLDVSIETLYEEMEKENAHKVQEN